MSKFRNNEQERPKFPTNAAVERAQSHGEQFILGSLIGETLPEGQLQSSPNTETNHTIHLS